MTRSWEAEAIHHCWPNRSACCGGQNTQWRKLKLVSFTQTRTFFFELRRSLGMLFH